MILMTETNCSTPSKLPDALSPLHLHRSSLGFSRIRTVSIHLFPCCAQPDFLARHRDSLWQAHHSMAAIEATYTELATNQAFAKLSAGIDVDMRSIVKIAGIL